MSMFDMNAIDCSGERSTKVFLHFRADPGLWYVAGFGPPSKEVPEFWREYEDLDDLLDAVLKHAHETDISAGGTSGEYGRYALKKALGKR